MGRRPGKISFKPRFPDVVLHLLWAQFLSFDLQYVIRIVEIYMPPVNFVTLFQLVEVRLDLRGTTNAIDIGLEKIGTHVPAFYLAAPIACLFSTAQIF
jgi:hypothetical protein